MRDILLVEDKESLGKMLLEALQSDNFTVDWIRSGSEAIRRIAGGQRYTVVLTDLRMPGEDGLAVLRAAKEHDSACPVIVMTAFGTIEDAVEAMKLGAYDFIQKPVDLDYLTLLVRRSREHRDLRVENVILREQFRNLAGVGSIIGESPAIQQVSEQVRKVAASDATVLLTGESGTGKELFARAVHQLSPRRERPFIAINCAAIPETLLENELFGHERGAYTGASARQAGKFELANGGTIFLDEIGDLGFSVQSKLLRVLQDGTFDRIGGTATTSVDVRVVCATNQDLRRLIEAGRFREDLFFRIAVFPITIPPLRDRKSDLDALITHFLRQFAREMKRGDLVISEGAREILEAYDWPGNVRELENCIERAVILCDGVVIETKDLNLPGTSEDSSAAAADLSGTLAEVVARTERLKLRQALSACSSRAEAAEQLGISLRSLNSKLREHGIDG